MKTTTLLALSAAALATAACNGEKTASAPGAAPAAAEVKAVPRPASGDWSEVTTESPQGGFIMGNPAAKVKLVEFGSMTCPHCREFDEKGVPALIDKYVKTGRVSWEFRTYLLNGLDLPAALIARCNGAKTFFPLARALYKDQPTWVGKVRDVPQAEMEQIQSLPPNQQFVRMATLAGLQDWAAMRGVPAAKSNQCLSNTDEVNKLVQLTSDVSTQFPEFAGTPSFILNGTLLKQTASWDKLEPALKDALR